MKIIIVSNHHGSSRSITLGGWTRVLLSVCLLGMPVVAGGVLGYHFFVGQDTAVSADSRKAWEQALAEQKEQITQSQRQAEAEVSALTLRLAGLQARLMRLDALGERLTSISRLDSSEFIFGQAPALGGPESDSLGRSYTPPDFLQAINTLSRQIEDREQQLETLDALLTNRKFQSDSFIAGRPVQKGWMSSHFGRRIDPFTGRSAWHEGVDFAGKEGSAVVSVAAGLVTWSGKRNGYGQMIEVSHGGGFSTRYAHNKENNVAVGDVIKKGQVIALMGSSGRSTGPHVHFEVYKNGRAVDPSSYINRTLR